MVFFVFRFRVAPTGLGPLASDDNRLEDFDRWAEIAVRPRSGQFFLRKLSRWLVGPNVVCYTLQSYEYKYVYEYERMSHHIYTYMIYVYMK